MTERWLRRASLFGLLGGFLGAISRLTFADVDMFHEMAVFREALRTGWIPRQDLFAYTPTIDPVVHHEWGTGAVLYAVVAGGGATGLMLLKYLLSFGVAAGCFVLARRRGASEPVLTCLAPLAIALGWLGFTTLRAQLFTLVFLVCLLCLLNEDAKGRRWWLAAWLLVYVIWANMHAGVVAGCGLFGVYALERVARESAEGQSLWRGLWRVRHLAAAGLLMVGLLNVNPYGWDYLPYLWRAVRMERPLVTEWRPIWQGMPWAGVTVFALSLLLVAYAVLQRGVRRTPGLLMVLLPAWLALEHTRHTSIYAVVWICLVPGWLDETGLGRAIRQTWRNRASLLLVFWTACGVVGLTYATGNRFWELRIPTSPTQASRGEPIYPAGAADYLARHRFEGNLMVPFEAGAFVTWKLYPRVKVSVDSRYEVAYPAEVVEECFALYEGQDGWRRTLTRYATDAVLVPRSSNLHRLLEPGESDSDTGRWRRVYQDDGYSLYMRKDLAEAFPIVDRTGAPVVALFP